VFIPRDRFNTDTRLAIQRLLLSALGGVDVTYETRVTESVLARLNFVIRGDESVEAVDVDALELRIAAVVRDWSDDLQDRLVDEHGEEQGIALARRYAGAFSPGYRSDHTVRTAVSDIERLEALAAVNGHGALDAHLYRRLEAPHDELRLRVFRLGPLVPVSDLVPVLEHLGTTVIDQRPYTVDRAAGDEAHIYDIGLKVRVPVDVDDDGPRVVETLHAVWEARTQSDGFHRLVLGADLTWREIAIVRAYARYLRQVGIPFSQGYVEECVCGHPAIVRRLMELFHARFAPTSDGNRPATDAIEGDLASMLDGVASLDADRVLRCLVTLVRATVRTNAYQPDAGGRLKEYLSFKFDSALIPFLPLPRPYRAIFVYSTRVEGVHLRGGPVARGGLRWSDRREDYRTEVLGLMKAQMVKNTVIVPTGAKGGFVVKRPPAGPDELKAEVVACYRTFVSGLLDLTDNLVGGQVVPPPGVVCHDGDDPYLVVAADKGTATFSDLANEVAAEYGFWLGDAFASGGSAGYDHKRMGITARGAWESVKRHFRELGVDVQTTPITAVGIGDMSGDVFGNGMLLSDQLRLVAAFNHMHVFIDPDPDPATSFAERRRLFDLPRSTWDDYDRNVLSPGAGIFLRSAKSIPLTAEMRAVLGIEDEALPPNDVIRAILRAPVDLLWNGGIGTYVKASTETHADVGDKANDGLRVDADQLRCKVVGEGGNLGFTQRSRIQYARLGGRINNDAIDNSAGVDCSDHEVNIKIVLDAVVDDGDLTVKQRNALLADMTDEVAELVLADNIRQNQALVNAVVQAPSLIDVHQRYLRFREAQGDIDRAVEFLPSDEQFVELKAAGMGLSSPEFAVLLAYTKNLLAADLVDSSLPDDPWCDHILLGYFPVRLREQFPARIRAHRLRREIIATIVANEVVDHQGITSTFRLRDETGADPAEAAAAVLAATEIFDLHEFRGRVAELDHVVPAAVQTRMLLEARKLAERAARWFLRAKRSGSIGDTIERYQPGVATMIETLPSLLVGTEKAGYDQLVAGLVGAGVPLEDATRTGEFEELFACLDCVELAEETGTPIEHAAAVRFQLEDRLGLRWLQDQVLALPRDNRWQALARLSLREDLQAQLRRLTGLALAGPARDASQPAPVGAARWVSGHEPQVGRLALVLSDIRATGTADLATLSVGLREVAQLA
jgi:glutamate dehydrogenase